MTKPKILLLIDGQGWVLDRIAQGVIEKLSHKYNFITLPYASTSDAQYLKQASKADLVHYQNWDIRIPDALVKTKCPVLISVRSHRFPTSFPAFVYNTEKKFDVHTITPQIQEKFPGSVYIPDPIFESISNTPIEPFRVGMAFQNNSHNRLYKGVLLVEEVCNELGCEFVPLPGTLPPEKMPDWFKSLNLYVCASENEAASTPVLECMALNVPVITTDVGIPSLLNVHKILRTKKSISDMIQRFFTRSQVLPAYSWDYVIPQIDDLYTKLIQGAHND